jgi:uncharacterized protein DUF748
MRAALEKHLKTLTPRTRRRLAWSVGIVVFYTIFGFLVLPLIVKAVAVKQLSALLDREVTIRKVRINPYVLSGTIRGLLIKDKDGEPFVSWEEAYANFQLVSFFGKAWVFKEVRTSQPFVRCQVNRDYSLNVSDLITKFSQPAPSTTEPKKPLVLRVKRFHIAGARASFADLTPRTPFRRIVGPLEITLTAFHTDPNNKNPYAFSGTTDSGEKFSWSGHFFLDPIRSEGELSLEGLSIPKYAALYQDLVRFEIKDGVVNARSAYRFGISASNYVAAVSNAAFSLKSLKVAEKESTNNLVELDELAVTGVTADAVARSADVASVFVNGGRLALKRNRDETVNMIEMARPAEGATNAPGGILFLLHAATNVFAALLESTNLASATLHELNVTNCALVWEDFVNSRPVRLPVDEIAITARELSNVPGSNMTVNAALRWNTNGTVRVETTAGNSPPSANVTLAVSDVDLRPLDPYLEPFLNLFILGSKVGLDGRIQMRTATNDLPEVTFRGDVRLDDFSTVDGVMAEDLVKWTSVRISGVDARLNPPVIAVNEFALIEPYARLAVETNHTINLLTALKLGGTNAPAAPEDSPVSAQTRPGKKAGLGQRFGGMLRQTLAGNTNATGSPLLPKITIGTVVISNAHVRFDDRSLQPRVNASIQELSGTITDLSTEELKRADLHLVAKVDRTGPVEIKGKINPLNQNAPTELQVVFHDVDLSPTSPYAGKFLGYRLNRGKLNLDVNYQVSEKKLKASNLIVLDQFTLGEKVDSPDATKLPVRLAIAVLKDRNGRIELDVPIEGSLDDPEFRLGKVIGRTIVNVITKIVTSPFAVLGSVFGGKGEEVSFQDFAPGSAELQASNLQKLDTLVSGLEERPGLQLEIEGSFDPTTDRQALRRQNLERESRQQKWTALRQSEQKRVRPEELTLTPQEWQDYLQKTYAAILKEQAVADSTAATDQTAQTRAKRAGPGTFIAPEKGAVVMVQGINPAKPAAPVDEIEQAVLKTVVVDDEELRQLAQERARRVQAKILEIGKTAPERIFLTDIQSAGSSNQASRVYFHLR